MGISNEQIEGVGPAIQSGAIGHFKLVEKHEKMHTLGLPNFQRIQSLSSSFIEISSFLGNIGFVPNLASAKSCWLHMFLLGYWGAWALAFLRIGCVVYVTFTHILYRMTMLAPPLWYCRWIKSSPNSYWWLIKQLLSIIVGCCCLLILADKWTFPTIINCA